GLEQTLDAFHAAIEVGLQFFAEFFTRRFVGRIALVTKRESGVMHPAEVVGPVCCEQALKEVDHAPGRRRVFTATRGERPGDESEEGAIDERVAIDEKEAR